MTTARQVNSNATLVLAGAAALLALTVGGNAHAAGGSGLADASCTNDADCADGFECDLGPTLSIDCPPGADDCDATPDEPRVGECEPKEMTCEVDADCVAGLSCEHHDDSDCASIPKSAADGGTPPSDSDACEPSEPRPGECVYNFVSCKKNSDCDGGLVCTALGSTSECSSNSAAPCMAGQDCPAPEEETCTETTRSYCFPPRVDCESDDDCDDGARCAALSEDAQEDPPPSWEGATALCLPEAIALVLEGRVDASGDASSSGSASNENGTSKSSDDSAGGGEPRSTDSKSENTADAGEAPKTDVVEDDGCAVSAPGSRDAGHAWLLLLGALALGVRRRRIATTRRPD